LCCIFWISSTYNGNRANRNSHVSYGMYCFFPHVGNTVGFNPTRSVDVICVCVCVCAFCAVSEEASRRDEPLPRRPTKYLVTLFISSENGRLYVDGMETEIFAALCWAYKCLV